MKVLGLISTTAVFLLFGATVPAFAQEEHHDESAKPAQHEEQAKPAAKQEQAKPQKQEQQAKPAKQEQAKPEKQQQEAKPQKQEQQAKSQEQNQQNNKPKASNSSKRINISNRSRLSRTKRRVSSITNSKPMAKRNNHRESTHEMVRRIGTDTNTTKVVLVLTIMPALKKTVGATTTDAESTLTAAIGSMQEHIRRGFTSRTCTSFWERTGSGMQWHTMTLL